eukprot:3803705-Pyramimonas_sp.AAC.1
MTKCALLPAPPRAAAPCTPAGVPGVGRTSSWRECAAERAAPCASSCDGEVGKFPTSAASFH